jgi:hypothetical protein
MSQVHRKSLYHREIQAVVVCIGLDHESVVLQVPMLNHEVWMIDDLMIQKV